MPHRKCSFQDFNLGSTKVTDCQFPPLFCYWPLSWTTLCSEMHQTVPSKDVKTNVKKHLRLLFDLSLLYKQDTLESKAKPEFLSPHPKESPVRQSPSTLSGSGKPRAEPLSHCLLCLPLYSSTETCNSLDAGPPVSFTSGQESWYNESIL